MTQDFCNMSVILAIGILFASFWLIFNTHALKNICISGPKSDTTTVYQLYQLDV